MLVGAGELVEESGLAAVLVAHQGEGQLCPLGQRLAGAAGMELALLAEARVRALASAPLGGPLLRGRDRLDRDLLRVRQTQCQLVAVDAQLHRVAQRGQLHHGELRAGDDPHIQKVLPQRPLAADGEDPGALSWFYISCSHASSPQFL